MTGKTKSIAATNAAETLAAEAETILSALCGLLDRETEAVKAADFESFKEMQADKCAMLARYKALNDTLKKQSATIKALNDAMKDRLRETTKRFQTSSDRNLKALEAGRASMQRISERIIRCARETVHATRQTYNRNGYSSLNAQTAVSLKVDEVL